MTYAVRIPDADGYEGRRCLWFGITESIFGVGLGSLLGGGLSGLGLGAGTAGAIGTIGADVLGGTAGGAALGGLTGQGAGKGALGGSLAGLGAGVGGAFGPGIAEATGIPETAVDTGIGAAGGLLGAEATGGSPLTGALTGAVSGATQGLTTPSAIPAAAPTGSPVPLGGSASAAGIAGGGTPSDAFVGTITDAGPAGPAPMTDTGAAPSSFGGGPSTIPGTTNVTDASGNLIGQDFSSGATGGGSGVSDFITKHWPMLASAGILGFQGLTQNKNLPQENQLQGIANAQSSEAAALTNPINTGQLPPGAAQAVSSATASQKAGISDTFSKLGLSGSTMEQQAKAGVDRQAATQTFQIADQLLSKGIQLSQLSAQDLQFLIEEQLKGDQQFQSALSSFAGGLAGQRLTG